MFGAFVVTNTLVTCGNTRGGDERGDLFSLFFFLKLAADDYGGVLNRHAVV